jgi:hypothetical protein
MIEPLLLTAARVNTFDGQRPLTNASGFYFERESRLFLVTSRHVIFDESSRHFPDRLEIEMHLGLDDVGQSTGFSIPLYQNGRGLWSEATDRDGKVDVAAIEIDRGALPPSVAYQAFTPQHLFNAHDRVEVGTGLRFQGAGYFLTDGRTHRGSSGSPVVARCSRPSLGHGELPWLLLGIHSARIDVGTRDIGLDEALGLNSAWYADVLMEVTAELSKRDGARGPHLDHSD